MKLRYLYRVWKARVRVQALEITVGRALVHPGDFVIDAGAHKGAYLYWLRRFVGRSGSVLAYEPQPQLARYLLEICSTFRWQNAQVQSIALSNRAGTSTLHVPGTGVSPGASLQGSVLEKTTGVRIVCRTDTLDSQLAQRPLLKFLKADVEGHELALFEGATKTLQRDHPALLFECEARHLTHHKVHDVFSFLQKLGYEGYLLTQRELLPIARFDLSIHQPRLSDRFWDARDYFNNFLFVAKALPPSLKQRISPA